MIYILALFGYKGLLVTILTLQNLYAIFFSFPKYPDLQKKWVIATKRKGFSPSRSSKLCSQHFEEKYFEVGGLRRRLKNGAIPSIFDFPLHLQKQQTKRRKIIVSHVPTDDLADLKGTNQILPASEDMSVQQVTTLFIKVRSAT